MYIFTYIHACVCMYVYVSKCMYIQTTKLLKEVGAETLSDYLRWNIVRAFMGFDLPKVFADLHFSFYETALKGIIYICINIHVCVCACACASSCVCVYIYEYISICIYMYMYMCKYV